MYSIEQYREEFFYEARSHILNMNNSLMALEKDPLCVIAFQGIFRSIHTFKSLAMAVGYTQIADFCHLIEDILDAIRYKTSRLSNCTNLLFKCFDHLKTLIEDGFNNKKVIVSDMLIREIANLLQSVSKNQMEAISTVNFVSEEIKTIEVKVEKIDKLMHLSEELITKRLKFKSIMKKIQDSELLALLEECNRIVSEVQYHTMQIRLLPINIIFNRFARSVRDLAKQQEKDINLEIYDGDIELDRFLAEEIGQTISHLVRNAVDHGIELPGYRKKLGKNTKGTIQLRASRLKDKALIEVSDDGKGIDFEIIRKAAKNEKENNIGDNDLLFSGISTKHKVSPVSGRGVGLSIVKHIIEKIGGTITIDSKINKGTTFLIEIPLTLTVIKTLFIKVNNEIYAIPIESIDRLLTVKETDLNGVLDTKNIIFNGKNISVLPLRFLFGHKEKKYEKYNIVIIQNNSYKVGLLVDEILSTEEIVIKPLNKTLNFNKLFSGASLIGTGGMVFVFDIPALFQFIAAGKKNQKDLVNE